MDELSQPKWCARLWAAWIVNIEMETRASAQVLDLDSNFAHFATQFVADQSSGVISQHVAATRCIRSFGDGTKRGFEVLSDLTGQFGGLFAHLLVSLFLGLFLNWSMLKEPVALACQTPMPPPAVILAPSLVSLSFSSVTASDSSFLSVVETSPLVVVSVDCSMVTSVVVFLVR
jgi:hypothetical protein